MGSSDDSKEDGDGVAPWSQILRRPRKRSGSESRPDMRSSPDTRPAVAGAARRGAPTHRGGPVPQAPPVPIEEEDTVDSVSRPLFRGPGPTPQPQDRPASTAVRTGAPPKPASDWVAATSGPPVPRSAPRAAAPPRPASGGRPAVTPGSNPPTRPSTTAASSEAEAAGLELPGYRIIKFFGKGGMGEVFLADRISDTGVSVRCVVKTVRQGVGNREQFQNMFLDEARIVSHLRHPNIVSTIDVGRAGGRLFLAMEWIDGLDAGKLAKLAIEQGTDIPLPHVLYILRETLKGLHYAHTAVGPDGEPLRIVHRDISQGNILISKHGAVKLADFGVAVGTAVQTEGTADALAGKPHYFAPELWRGAKATPATDVFALGVTFYELMSSRPLFRRGIAMPALAFEVGEFRVERLIEEDLTIPDGLEDIIIRALHEDPSQRYDTALAFLEDVNDYAYEFGIRLLDAHFGDYVGRMLGEGSKPNDGRRRLWKD